MKKLEYDIESISPSLKRLASNYDSDQKSIKEYYKENSSKVKFSKWLNSNDIIGFIRRLFFLDYDNEDVTFENVTCIAFIMNIIFFFLNCIILKLGYNYSIFPLSILITLGIFLYYNIQCKFQGIIINCLIYFFSVFLVNYQVYNASKEGRFTKYHQNMIVKDSLDRNQFFIENLQTFNKQNYKLIKYD